MADGKQSLLLTSLRSFYTDMDNCRIFLDVIQAQNRYPSLRILDWLVTNYAKKHNMVYEYNGKDINISPSYKQQLCAYSKRQFDPFCRRTRIVFPMPDPRPCPTPPACAIAPQTSCNIDISFPEEARLPRNFNPGPDVVVHNLITTTGQLNFFRWAITSGIIDYAVENRELIEQDMNESSKTRPKHTRSSSAAVKERNAALKPMGAGVVKKAISKRNVRIVMSFN